MSHTTWFGLPSALAVLLVSALVATAQPVVIQPSPGLNPKTPIRSGTSAQTPTSCVATKELWIKTDATPGQQLFLCNAAGNGFVLLGGGSGVTSVATGSGLTGGPITTTGTVSCQTASGAQFGCLAAADWTTFNAKQAPGNYLVDPGSNGLVQRTALNTTTALQSPDKKILGNMSGATATPTSIDPQALVSSNYAFTPQAPNVALAAGVPALITLTPVPAGVNGADANHRLYISAGVGTAEAVLITGGSAVSGAASGTLAFTPANNHSGAWTIQSATAGIQEAMQVQAANLFAKVDIPAGIWTMYAKLSCPVDATLRGAGMWITNLNFTTGFTSRGIECINPPNHRFNLSDLSIGYLSAGASQEALYLQDIGDGTIQNIALFNSYDGITGNSVARVYFRDITMLINHNGYNIFSHGGGSASVPGIFGGFINMPSGIGAGIHFGAIIAGMTINGLQTVLGAYGILLDGGIGDVVNEVNISNCIFDSYSTAGLFMSYTTSASSQRWSITDTFFAGASGNVNGILVATTTPGNINSFTFNNNKVLVSHANGAGLNLQGIYSATIAGNIINNNVAGGYGILLDGTANTNMTISGNISGVGSAYNDTNPFAIGILLNNQAHTGIRINGNYLKGSSAPLANAGTGGAGAVTGGDVGIVDFRPGFVFANIAQIGANGLLGYCSDCTIANPCAGGGTGAIAKRLNNVNVCN